MMILLDLNIGLFFGRFHALVVHLPIGFLLLGGIFYFLERKQQQGTFQKALPHVFFLASISSILAVIFGSLLANEGGYASDTLFWHRWLGIGTAILTSIIWLSLSDRLKMSRSTTQWGIIAMLLLLTITGHLGGTLTHGASYLLDYAPSFIQNGFGNQQISTNEEYPQNPDSILIYDHLIQPVFDEKCVSCHNGEKAKGGLLLDSKEGLLAGGDHGDVLQEKSKHKIELLHRVTLPMNEGKFMPPTGSPMTFYEIKLLEYWIKNGHSFEQAITDKNIPTAIKDLIQQVYGLSDQRKSFVELNSVNPANPEAINVLQDQGFFVSALSRKSNFLQVRYSDSITCEKLQLLLPSKTQISWLDLSKTRLPNDCLDLLGQLTNLTKLNLSQNAIENSSLQHLVALTNLESLNLYNTSISNEGLKSLEQLPSLRHLYLWETNINQDDLQQLKEKRPHLNINLGPQ
jgi:uncharacterized membrane protein